MEHNVDLKKCRKCEHMELATYGRYMICNIIGDCIDDDNYDCPLLDGSRNTKIPAQAEKK